MIQKAKDHIRTHSGKYNIAAYSALIIYGANLLIEHGELKATNYFQEQMLTQLVDEMAKCD